MTPKEILLAAADEIERRKTPYCCIALKSVSGCYYDDDEEFAKWQENSENYHAAYAQFKYFYKPTSAREDEAWFDDEDYEVRRQDRIMALRNTAATFE